MGNTSHKTTPKLRDKRLQLVQTMKGASGKLCVPLQNLKRDFQQAT